MTGITTTTRQGGGLVCVDTSRDTGTAPGVSLNWYRDGIKLQRQTSSSLQSYLGWSAYFEFNLNKRIWLKRDEDTEATEGVFSVIMEGALHLKQLSQLVSTIPVSVGIFCIILFTFTLALKSAGVYNYANVNVCHCYMHVCLCSFYTAHRKHADRNVYTCYCLNFTPFSL